MNTLVQWRGNVVSEEKEAKALRHVFDDLQDHFGHQRPDPRVRFNIVNLAHPGQGHIWHGDVEFTYDIEGDHCNLKYMSMDVCVDLTPKLVHRHGQPMLQNYGKTWVYVYLPQPTIDRIKSYVKAGTGWDVSDEGFIEDPNRNVTAIEAKMNHRSEELPEPSFWAMKDKDASEGEEEIMSFSRIGSVQVVMAQSHQQHVHRGVGIFSVTMEVEGTPNFMPTPGEGDEAKLRFTLVSARTWGFTESVAPIVYAPSKWH
eukprot:scaffold16_cov147-Skeletonema_menzelii.AAC.1